MTDNPNLIPFKNMPREDQDRIAGAIVRGEAVEWWWGDEWVPNCMGIKNLRAYRIPPAPKPPKDPNRPRPAHKLNLQKGDVVRHEGWQDDFGVDMGIVKVGEGGRFGKMLQLQIDTPIPKGKRPLFVVVSRANGSS